MFTLTVIILVLFGVLIARLFNLQIVNGASYQENFTLKIVKEKNIKSTRGKIFDKNGKVLAYDELAYSVTIEDNYETSGSEKNEELNDTIRRLIHIVEDNGNKLNNDFDIVLDKNDQFVFNVSDKALLRFLADVYGHSKTSQLKVTEKTATPDEVIDYLAGEKVFGIGTYDTTGDKKVFNLGDGYTKQELLKTVTIRYAMNSNSFQKYIETTVATGLNEKTVAIIMENKNDLRGVDITEDTVRKYIDDPSLSPILGYTGKISETELETLNQDTDKYELNDYVGKAGVEQVMEEKLQGTKGHEEVYVDNVGKVVEVSSKVDPIAGNDLYLTIDADLQSAVYKILEQRLAGILIANIRNVKEYNPGENASASNIITPIDDVYFALFNNSIIDISHMHDADAQPYEKMIAAAYDNKQASALNAIKEELANTGTPYQNLDKEYQVYESFIVSMLTSSNINILLKDKIDEKDETYLAWKDETISLKEYLQHAIAKEWIDVTKLDLNEQYADSEETYTQLIQVIIDNLKQSNNFSKKVLKYMIRDNDISGQQVCMVLYEQNVITDDLETRSALENGTISAYSFMLDKIKNLEITPAQLALDPCTGSCVITDVNTGEVRACVSYPSYDNNRLANTIDADYYNELTNDLSNPLYSYATQQKTAPGSTFKMVSSVAGLEEGVISLGETINCVGIFDKIGPQNPKCWKYPSRHGPLDVTGGIRNSCNYFFYEVGFRLGTDASGKYNSDLGLSKLRDYSDQFGLTDLSGIELTESEPEVSTEDAVRSAIGQGTNSYTTVQIARYVTTVANSGTCYNLSLMDKLVDPSGNVLEDYQPEVRNQVEASSAIWNAVHTGMRGVVEDHSAFKGSIIEAAGKTGTAQLIKSRPNHALFVGYAPYNNPQISIATRIAYGYTSANTAAVARSVFDYYFKQKNEEDIITGKADATTSTVVGD